MVTDKDRLLKDAEEFNDLVQILMDEAGMDKETAERVVIHSGHKNIEQLVLDLFEFLAEYVDARGQNSAQLNGMIKSIVERVKSRR